MKKLKIKVFSISFGILSIVLITIFIFINIKKYYDYKKEIVDILNRNTVDIDTIIKRQDKTPSNDIFNEINPRQVFVNYKVYTVILNEELEYIDVINHTDEELDTDKIKEITNNIIENHKTNYYVGNLIFDKYSYSITKNNTLIIIDNTDTNKNFIINYIENIIIVIFLEIILYFISYLLTKWVIDPVNDSFERQKRFIADASHELKTPLTVMIASSDAYYKDKDIKWINNMRSEAERMTDLVKDLLDLSQIENDKNNNFKENNLSNIINSSILTTESLFFESNIKLNYNIEPNIKLNCDKNQIKQLITILLDNAIRHTENKGKVVINLSKENKNIILEVKNKGKPIPKKEEEKIFERFYKSDESRNRDNNNYGLGLAIAKSIVINHKATITASSKDGYTTFKVKWNQ